MYDHSVGRSEIDANSPRSCREKKDKNAPLLIESIYDILAILGRAIEPDKDHPHGCQAYFENVQNLCPLREEKDSMSLRLKFWEESAEETSFCTGPEVRQRKLFLPKRVFVRSL